jgi:hypothetical protein
VRRGMTAPAAPNLLMLSTWIFMQQWEIALQSVIGIMAYPEFLTSSNFMTTVDQYKENGNYWPIQQKMKATWYGETSNIWKQKIKFKQVWLEVFLQDICNN